MSSENSSFSNYYKNEFSAKNLALGVVLIACPIIGIPYGASLLLKKNNDNNIEKKKILIIRNRAILNMKKQKN